MQSTNPVKDLPHYLRVFQSYLGSRMYLAFGLTLFAGLAEGFGILMLLPLLRGVDAGGGGASEPATGVAKVMEDMLGVFGWADSTIEVLLVITVAFLLKGVLLFGAKGYKAYLRGQSLRELKGELFDCYARMRYRYYVERDTGHFTNVINQQTNLALQAFQTLTQFFTQFISTLVYIALAFVVAWRFGLMALAFGIGLMWLFRRLNHYVRDLSRRKAQENGHLAKLLIQFLHAFKYLTATGQARPLRGRVTQSVGRLTGYEMRSGIAQAFTEAAREPIAVVAIMLIVIIQLVFMQQPLAPIMVSILLFYRGMNATLSMQGTWQQTLNQIGSLEMVRDEFADQAEHREPDGQRPAPALAQGITLDRVSFAYDDSLGAVIEDVPVSIPVRTSVALVRESGAGKSTLWDLITLMLKPQAGEVRVDGILGSGIELATRRKQIGYVSQETVVFDGTIANNICMWQGDPQRDEALMERIREAARQGYIAHRLSNIRNVDHVQVFDHGRLVEDGASRFGRLVAAQAL